MTKHETFIKRCLQIAKNGFGTTNPNPMVGCVVVSENIIIGEGFTSPFGGNHAEVNAINSIKNKSLLKSSALYVTLEPWSHHGKTPPCSDLIIEHEIPKVVIGCLDINEKVAGKGIERLRNSGCNVTVGVLENECKQHHKRFFTFHDKKRPYIILKWAETLDGLVAPEAKEAQKPVWITNNISRQLVHKWRAEEQAILIGSNTILQDNPILTARDWKGRNPVRFVLALKNKLPDDSNIFNEESETIIISSNLKAKQICEVLHKKNINSVIIEGGTQTLQTFIDAELWDEARIFTGNINFNKGVKAPKFEGQLISEQNIELDVLKFYIND